MRRQKLAAGSLLLTLLFLTTAGNSYAFKNEPDGFRGVQWGDSPSVLENKQQWLADGNTNYFIKPDDEMQVGGATVSLIVYEFWKDKFASAIIHTKGRTHWKTLKAAVFERFGAGKKKNTYKEEYRWGSPWQGKSFIHLEYDSATQEVLFFITSAKIWVERAEHEKQTAKENAAKGF